MHASCLVHVFRCSSDRSRFETRGSDLVIITGRVLQHADEVQGGAGAADPGSRGVLQQGGDAARFARW